MDWRRRSVDGDGTRDVRAAGDRDGASVRIDYLDGTGAAAGVVLRGVLPRDRR